MTDNIFRATQEAFKMTEDYELVTDTFKLMEEDLNDGIEHIKGQRRIVAFQTFYWRIKKAMEDLEEKLKEIG